jgi:restriction system protein
MAVPDFQSFFKPLLNYIKDGNEYTMRELKENLFKSMNILKNDLEEMLPSGTQTRYDNRIYWSKAYLLQAKCVDSPKRGIVKITERGQQLLNSSRENLRVTDLNAFPEFVAFRQNKGTHETDDSNLNVDVVIDEKTPLEVLESSVQTIQNGLATELLNRVHGVTPADFEKLVVQLLVKMGYGGSIKDAGQVTKLSGDEGIDGTIKEDRLGLGTIYIQAKKWAEDHIVGRPEIQKFVGALAGQRAKKGIFITTSSFSKEARDYTSKIDTKIVLIDGKQLADWMIECNLGVSVQQVYEVKKIDSDFFGDD